MNHNNLPPDSPEPIREPLTDFQYLIWDTRRLDWNTFPGNTDIQARVLRGLSGKLDLLDTFPAGIEMLGAIGLPIPPLYVLNEIHQYTDLSPEDARLILRVLIKTQSIPTYTATISFLLSRFPELWSEFPELSGMTQ